MTEHDVAKLVKLVGLARDEQDKLTHILDELDAILGGKASIGEQMKQGRLAFDTAWSARYGTAAYVWNNVRDMPQLKRLIKMLGVPEFAARCGRYIQNSEPYVTKARHSFAMFVATINQYATASPDFAFDSDSAAVGCKHKPPCKTDAIHTTRLQSELRS